MTATRANPEAERVGAPVVAWLDSKWRRNHRSDVPVTLPDHGPVSIDHIIRADAFDGIIVIEDKVRLSRELEHQGLRSLPYANQVYVAYEQSIERDWKKEVAQRCDRAGVGRIIVVSGSVRKIIHAPWRQVDTSLLIEAYEAHDGSHDPAAGAAAAHRITPDRAMLCEIAKACGPTYMEITDINHADVRWRTLTAHRLRTIIDANRDWKKLPLDHRGHARTQFFSTDGAKTQ